jgi:hypothetical protein
MCQVSKLILAIGAVSSFALSPAIGQQLNPPPGYFDIPAGFDFPADKQKLEQFRASGDVHAQRLHVWNIFAGMTQTTPDGRFAIFETWFSEDEAFATGPVPQASGPRRVVRRFNLPRQFSGAPGQPTPEAAGSALLSEVMFNFVNFKHIQTEHLNSPAEITRLQQTGAPDPKIPNNRTVPQFPAEAISLKTVWWPVAGDQPTAMPIWDPENNPLAPGGNSFQTWKRVVAIDPTRTNIPPNETMTVQFPQGNPRPNSHVVGLDQFHSVQIDAQTAANAMANGRLQVFVRSVLGRPLQEGDFVVFAGTHLTTKEIDDWIWATFWWHDRPDAGPFAADRLDSVKGVWRNYLMSASYDLNLPHEADGTAHITFNPWLEAGFRQGIVSNCMNCHNRAAIPGSNGAFLPVKRGDPDLQNDPAYAAGSLRTDFLWSIPFRTQQ